MKIRNKFSEISAREGIQVMELLDEGAPSLPIKAAIVGMLLDLPKHQVIDISNEEGKEKVNKAWEVLDFSKKVSIRAPLVFRMGRKLYGLIDFEEMTLEEYADIDFYLNEGDNPWSYFEEILSIVYRPVVFKSLSVKNIFLNIALRLLKRGIIPYDCKSYKVAKYDPKFKDCKSYKVAKYDPKFKAPFLDKFDFNYTAAVMNHLMAFRDKLRKEYLEFSKPQEEDPFEKEESKTKDVAEIYGFYHIVNSISTDLFEREAWWKRNIREFLKYIIYLKQKNIEETINKRRDY